MNKLMLVTFSSLLRIVINKEMKPAKPVIVLSFCSLVFSDVFGIRSSQKKCENYRNMLQPTSEFHESDEDAAPKEYPFMARIENDVDYCNGILVSENFVLSTATCDFSFGNDYIILGDLDEGTDEDDTQLQRFDVIKKFEHPTSNIVLFQLNESVQFNEYILPACLSQSQFTISQQFIEIGWSSTNIRDNGRVHKVKMNYVSNTMCKEIFNSKNRTKYIREIDNGSIFCAQTRKGDREMCGGFNGAALLSNDRDAYNDEIIGIASVGFGCVNSNPAIFIRVSAYIDWIENIVWPNSASCSENTVKHTCWHVLCMCVIHVVLCMS